MMHLKLVLLLAIVANFGECGDAKFREKGELSPRRRRCYDGSLPKRLKKNERKLSLEESGGGEVCRRLYPRVSCCPSRRAPYQILHRRDARVCSRFQQPQTDLVFVMETGLCIDLNMFATAVCSGIMVNLVMNMWLHMCTVSIERVLH